MSAQQRLRLPAVLTQREAATALRTMGVSAAAPAGEWRVDASALVDFDSSALAVLLACKRMARTAQAALVVEGAPAKLVRLAGLYGLESLLPVLPAASPAAPAPQSAAT